MLCGRNHEHIMQELVCIPGTPPLTGSGTVRVLVHDVNDHSPEFERQSYDAFVVENLAAGAKVLEPRATDKDADLNAKIRLVSNLLYIFT